MTAPVSIRGLVVAALVVAVGCSGTNGGEPRASDPRHEEPTEPERREERALEPAPRVEPEHDSACGRALACCRAYAVAVPHVVESSACAGVYEATDTPDPDARCDAMKEGWRQALASLPDAPADACE